MNPEAKARQKLEQPGSVAHDLKQRKPGAGLGAAVHEYSTGTGPANRVLLVNCLCVANARKAA